MQPVWGKVDVPHLICVSLQHAELVLQKSRREHVVIQQTGWLLAAVEGASAYLMDDCLSEELYHPPSTHGQGIGVLH